MEGCYGGSVEGCYGGSVEARGQLKCFWITEGNESAFGELVTRALHVQRSDVFFRSSGLNRGFGGHQ